MAKFSVAVRAGMSAAESAKQNKREIKEVLDSLAESIQQATNNAVTTELQSGITNKPATASAVFAAWLLGQPVYDALVLKGTKLSPPKTIVIARFTQSATGFPCRLSIESEEYVCADRQSLETVLSKIISTTAVGLAISELVPVSKQSTYVEKISRPLGDTRHRTIEGMVHIKSSPGYVIEEPFPGRTVRRVSYSKGATISKSGGRSSTKKASEAKSTVSRESIPAKSTVEKKVSTTAKLKGRTEKTGGNASTAAIKKTTSKPMTKPAVKKDT
jgi:hypothetical protein